MLSAEKQCGIRIHRIQLDAFDNASQIQLAFSCHFPAKLDGSGVCKETRKELDVIRDIPLLSICPVSLKPFGSFSNIFLTFSTVT